MIDRSNNQQASKCPCYNAFARRAHVSKWMRNIVAASKLYSYLMSTNGCFSFTAGADDW